MLVWRGDTGGVRDGNNAYPQLLHIHGVRKTMAFIYFYLLLFIGTARVLKDITLSQHTAVIAILFCMIVTLHKEGASYCSRLKKKESSWVLGVESNPEC